LEGGLAILDLFLDVVLTNKGFHLALCVAGARVGSFFDLDGGPALFSPMMDGWEFCVFFFKKS
jgi:hypothetical protein